MSPGQNYTIVAYGIGSHLVLTSKRMTIYLAMSKFGILKKIFLPNYPYIKSLSDGTRIRVVSLLREQIAMKT